MKKTLNIEDKYSDPTLNIVFDTIKIKKQALVFVNSRPNAESLAEKISEKINISDVNTKKILNELSEKTLTALSKPTKQCMKLANCIKKGMAFHHSGLASAQRELVEDNFRNGNIRIICCTPSLALGINLPSFRTIVRDLKRYGMHGLEYIPVLEYHQFIGRSGRPDFNDTYGEAVCIAFTEGEKDNIFEKYIHGEPEEITSKLAVEPILRTYVLSLIATDFVNSTDSLFEFFEKTFYAYQFKDLKKIKRIILRILELLEEWEFINYENNEEDDKKYFKTGKEIEEEEKRGKGKSLTATKLGRRVSELYLDPYTAFMIITCLRKSTSTSSVKANDFSLLQMVSSCLEIRPLLKCRVAEYEEIQEKLNNYSEYLLIEEPSPFSEEYEDFINSIKTTLFFMDWIDEKDEEYLLEAYNIRPGEIRNKLEIGDWLLYSAEELAKLLGFRGIISEIMKLRFRLKYGAREEILNLLKLRNIGRVRARILFKNGIKDIGDVKTADITKLAQLIGKNIAIDIKQQVGQEFNPDKIQVKEGKRKGQISLLDY